MVVDPLLGKGIVDATIAGAKWGIPYSVQWLRSYNLLILGQERARKSTFYKTLRTRILGRNGENTVPTIEKVNSGIFTFGWTTRDGVPISLELRNVGDRSGQKGPHEHAMEVARKKPHLVVIILDITSKEESIRIHDSYLNWFENFCTHLSEFCINSPRAARRLNQRLAQLVVLLNKVDCLDPASRDDVVKNAKESIS